MARLFRVGCLERPLHEAFDRITGAEPMLRVERFGLDLPHEAIEAGLQRCQGYCVIASRPGALISV